MQSIGSILTRNYQNPTLQRAYFEHQASTALEELYAAHHLGHWQAELTHLLKRRGSTVTLHLTSSNSLLLTHLRLQASVLEADYLRRLQALDRQITAVTLKLRPR